MEVMRRLLFYFGIVLVTLTACGPSSDELALQTREATTAIADNWTWTPTNTATPTSTSTLTPTSTPTLIITTTSTPTLTPTPKRIPKSTSTPDWDTEVLCWAGYTGEQCRNLVLRTNFILIWEESWAQINPLVSRVPWDASGYEEEVYYVCKYYPVSGYVKVGPSAAGLHASRKWEWTYYTYNELQVLLDINCAEILEAGPPRD